MDVSCLLLQPTPISPLPHGGGPDPEFYYNHDYEDASDYNHWDRVGGRRGSGATQAPEGHYQTQDPGFVTATTETATMPPPAPAVHTESPTTTTTPPPAMDVTLPFDPSFVDIAHPNQPPIPPPKDYRLKTRTNSKSSSSSSDGKKTPAALEGSRAGRPTRRSASTPVPKISATTSSTTATAITTTASTSNPRSSSKSRHHHRATKSHSHKDDGDIIVDLVKELRAAKKRERAGSLSLTLGLGGVKSLFSGLAGGGAGGGGAQDHEAMNPVSPVDRVHHPPFHYPRDPHSQSQPVPIPPPPPEPQQQPSVPRPQTSAEAIASAVKASLAMVDNAATTKKKRQRSASSASALPHSHSKSSSASSASSTTDSIVLLVQHLQHETARANAAEAQRRELLDKLRDVMKQKVELEGHFGMVKEELGLYKVQLDLAQKEILKAQEVVESVDRQRVLAEREATRNRERVRRLVEDQLVTEALEAGRREGYKEGMRRGKEARKLEEDNQRRLAAAREQERREREARASRIAAEERQKEQERAQREKERAGRRARSNTVGTVQDAAAAARARATTPLAPIPPPRPPTAGPSNWRQVSAQPPPRPSTAGPQNWAEPLPSRPKESNQQRPGHIPDAGHFAHLLPLPTLVTPVPLEVPPTQPQPPSAINTMHPQPQQRQSSQSSSSSSSSSQRIRQRTGSEDANRNPPSTTAPTRAQHGSMKGHLGHTPTAESERHPHYDKVVHPAYVPPPDNFIPAMNADGSLSLPPPHELGRRPVSVVTEEEDDDQDEGVTDYFGESAVISTPIRTHGRTYSVGSSNFAGEFEVANPEREMARMRMKMEVGDGETPTPAPSRTLPHHHQAKNKGKMRAINPDLGEALVDDLRPGSRAGEKVGERYGWDITRPPTTAPIPPPGPTSPDSRKPDRPPSRAHAQRDFYGKSNDSPPRWETLDAPPRGPYGGLRRGSTSNSSTPPERAPMIRSMTSGTTPEIGVEPPSQSPTTVEENTVIDPIMLTPDPAAQMHSSTTFGPSGSPQPVQNSNHPTSVGGAAQTEPVYGGPQLHPHSNGNDVRVGYFAAPPFPRSPFGYEGGSGEFQIYGSTAASAPRQGIPSSNHDDEEWFPPPPVPLSPIPAVTNIKSEDQFYGRPSPGERAKYVSPPALNRPISLFDDSE